MFPRSPEHADVLPIIPEAVSAVMLAGTVAFRCHFTLKSVLLTGLFRSCKGSAVYLYCPTDGCIIPPVNRERTAAKFVAVVYLQLKTRTKKTVTGNPAAVASFYEAQALKCNLC